MKKLKLPKGRNTTDPEIVPDAVAPVSDPPTPKRKARRRRQKDVAPNAPKSIPSSWQLFKLSLISFGAEWRSYLKIMLTAAVPIAVLSLLNNQTNDANTAAYVSLMSMLMNVCLLWAIDFRHRYGVLPGARQTYYDGSAAFVRFFLTFLFMVLAFLPAGVASTLVALSSEAVANGIISPLIQVYVVIVAAFVALPTLYWIVRRLPALVVVVAEDAYPLSAWRSSQALTARRFWPVARHLALLVVFCFIIAIPSIAVLVVCSLLGLSSLGSGLFELIATVTVLPVGYLYLYNLYLVLKNSVVWAKDSESAPASSEDQSNPNVARETDESGSPSQEDSTEVDAADDESDSEDNLWPDATDELA